MVRVIFNTVVARVGYLSLGIEARATRTYLHLTLGNTTTIAYFIKLCYRAIIVMRSFLCRPPTSIGKVQFIFTSFK